jgi:glycosidase
MIELRKTLPALQQCEIQFVETGRNGILSYTRTLDGQEITVLLNFSSRKQKVSCISGNCKLLFSTHRRVVGNGVNFLFPFEAMVLEKI